MSDLDFSELLVERLVSLTDTVRELTAKVEKLSDETALLKHTVVNQDEILEDEAIFDYSSDCENCNDYECENHGCVNCASAEVCDGCECTGCTTECDIPCCENDSVEIVPAIRNIYFCDEPGKEKTIVIFTDGSKVVKTLANGDIFDLNVGVALCIAERMFGGKTKFHKKVKKIAGLNEKK